MATKNFLHRTPADLQATLESNPALLAQWNSLTPLARNEWICWVTIVKKTETRTNHLTRLKKEILAGKRRPCCWPGCTHRRPAATKWFNTKK